MPPYAWDLYVPPVLVILNIFTHFILAHDCQTCTLAQKSMIQWLFASSFFGSCRIYCIINSKDTYVWGQGLLNVILFLKAREGLLEFGKSQASQRRNFDTGMVENDGSLFDVNNTLASYLTFPTKYNLCLRQNSIIVPSLQSPPVLRGESGLLKITQSRLEKRFPVWDTSVEG